MSSYVVGLIRVSSIRQAQEGSSLEDQHLRIERYAERNDLELVAIHADEGVTGRTCDRPGLQAAIADAKRLRGQLVVASLSRLARSTRGVLEIAEELERAGASIVSLRESFDSSTPVGRLTFRMLAALAEFEVDCLRERVADVMQTMRANHRRTSGVIPFGYRLDADGSTLTPVVDEQNAISLMHGMREDGQTYKSIATYLQEVGIPTRRGGPWTAKSVSGILRREAKITGQQAA